jgi:5-methylthioadenosine/S-adenosylhomocysteine deaminase
MTTAAHCCWLDQGECALLGERGAVAVHNPVSNMKLSVGRAMPYHWLKDARASVALHTDGCASNNNLDMFEEMKVAALLQKYSWNNPTQLPAHEAFTMATEAGARALGFDTGKIAVGYGADIILITTLPSRIPRSITRH